MIRKTAVVSIALMLVPLLPGAVMATAEQQESTLSSFTQGSVSPPAGDFRDVVGAEMLIDNARDLEDISTILDGSQRQKWVNKSTQTLRTGEVTLSGSGQIAIHAPSSTVRQFEEGYMVQHRLIGEDVVEPSTFTIFFDAEGTVLTSTQILLRDVGVESAGRMTTWTDGEAVGDYIINDAGHAQSYSSEAAESQDQVMAPQWSWTKFKQCLNRQGVSAWTVTAISIACGAICAITFGTLCAACIAAAGSVTATTIFYCARTS